MLLTASWVIVCFLLPIPPISGGPNRAATSTGRCPSAIQTRFNGSETDISPSVRKVSDNEWEIILPANLRQLDTGKFADKVLVHRGQIMRISAVGRVNASGQDTPTDGAFLPVGPNGWSTNPVFNRGRRGPLSPEAPFMALALRAGTGELSLSDGQWQLVGSQNSLLANDDGYLHFTVNDRVDPTGQADWWKNNQGGLRIRLTLPSGADVTTIRRYGSSAAEVNGQGALVALYGDACSYLGCTEPVTRVGVISATRFTGENFVGFTLRSDKGITHNWDYSEGDFGGFSVNDQAKLFYTLVNLNNRVIVTACGCGTGNFPSIESIVLDPAVPTLSVTGYIDIREIDRTTCLVGVLAEGTRHSGVVSFERLSNLTHLQITNYESAVKLLGGRHAIVRLSASPTAYNSSSSISFLNLLLVKLLPVETTSRDTWRERNTKSEVIVDLSTDIFFDFDRATIKPAAIPSLIRLARLIRQLRSGGIQLNGFTDSKGSHEYNMELSIRRAEAVKQWLVANGDIPAEKLATGGFGEKNPVAPNTFANGADNPSGRMKNRRVEVIIGRN